MLVHKTPEIVEYANELFNIHATERVLRKDFGVKSERMANALSEYISRGRGGKTIRAAYVFAGGIVAGDIKSPVYANPLFSVINKYLPAALSIQWDHNWFLIHDDPEDGSKKRRGGDAYHIQHGLDFAINDGDYLNLLAEQALIKAKEIWGMDIFWRMIKARTEMLKTTVHGQNYELEKRKVPLNETSLDDVTYIHRNKSGYTTQTPVQYALIIAGKPDSEISRFKEPMLRIAEGFQGIDDTKHLEMGKGDDGESTVTKKKFGKDFLGDLDEGKRTMPLILTYQRSDPTERKFLDDNIRNGPFDPRFENTQMDMPTKRKILRIMKKYNAIKDSKEIAINSANEGNKMLRELVPPSRIKELIAINNYCINREN